MNDFDKCTHNWIFQINADESSGPAQGNTLFRCNNCKNSITLIEKCTLDQAEAQKKSLIIQERHTKLGMIANVIAAITLIIAFLTLLFGNKIISYCS